MAYSGRTEPEDAISEGIEKEWDGSHFWYKDYCNNNEIIKSDPQHSFHTLWNSIYGSESWDSNPWVWVVEFKVLSTTGKLDNI